MFKFCRRQRNYTDKRYEVAERLCLYWAVLKAENCTPMRRRFWFDGDEITDAFPIYALQHVCLLFERKKDLLSDWLPDKWQLFKYGDVWKHPLNFHNNTINTWFGKKFILFSFSLQITQKLPCLVLLVESKVYGKLDEESCVFFEVHKQNVL